MNTHNPIKDGIEKAAKIAQDFAQTYGSQIVDAKDKTDKVHRVFSNVAEKYDIMNNLMSGGLHHLWKSSFVSKIDLSPNIKILDIASGSGDIAMGVCRQAISQNCAIDITMSDINKDMLDLAKDRFGDFLYDHPNATIKTDFVVCDAENMDFKDQSFDVVTLSFGLRNMTHIDKVIGEIARVLRPGGQLLIMEFGKPSLPIYKEIYDLYLHYIIPNMGALIVNDRDSYQYFVESIKAFPAKEVILDLMQHHGFINCSSEGFFFDSVDVYQAQRQSSVHHPKA